MILGAFRCCAWLCYCVRSDAKRVHQQAAVLGCPEGQAGTHVNVLL